MIHILVISPTPALRAGLQALLSSDPDLVVTTAASLADFTPEVSGRTRMTTAASGRDPALQEPPLPEVAPLPEVVVASNGSIDLAGPGLQPEQALLLVTDDVQEIQVLSAMELRAWGAISPETTAEALQTAVRALAGGLVAASPAILRQALVSSAGSGLPAYPGIDDGSEPALDPLTDREHDVLLRLAQGLTNKQIALALGISEHTVKFHVSSIYSKLDVSNRTEAVRKGARRGWIPL